MALDDISKERLRSVHPKLAEKVREMATRLEIENIAFRVVQGLRSWHEQQKLFNRGRDAEGNVINPMAVVTKARPGYSWHQFGLAVDLCPDDSANPGFQPIWDSSHPSFERMIAVGVSVGLTAGGLWRSFPDYPHFQLTGKWPVSPTDEVRQLFLDGGMEAVWAEAGL